MSDLTALPTRITVGNTYEYKRSYADYPATDGWTLHLLIAGRGPTLTVDADPDGAGFKFSLTELDTGSLQPGVHRWVEVAKKGSAPNNQVKDAATGSVIVDPSLATAAEGELQPWEEEALAIVEAALSGRLTSDLQEYQIAGRAVSKIPVSELMRIRAQLRAAVHQLRNPGQFGKKVNVAFTGVENER